MSEEELRKVQNDRIRQIRELLEVTLSNAVDEDEGTDLENDMYADMANLLQTVEDYLESEVE